jgi:surfeit locus 1 family protein
VRGWNRADRVFAIVFLLAGMVSVRLGIWQLDRLQERRAWNAQVESQMGMPMVDLSTGNLPSDQLAYRRAALSGEWQSEDQILLRNRSYNDQPGYHLVTPLQSESLPWAILVDRGWVPIQAGETGGLAAYQPSGMVTVEGVLLPSEDQPSWDLLADPTSGPDDEPLRAWRVLTIERVEQQLSYPLFEYYLAQMPSGEGADQPPIPDPVIDLSEGPHLGYAIQWFSFAAIAVVGGGYWLKRRLDGRQPREAEK